MNGSRVLIMGIGGMLGHKLWQEIGDRFEVFGTLRSRQGNRPIMFARDSVRISDNIDATDSDVVERLLLESRPEVVVNCIGVVKQSISDSTTANTIAINSVFPHALAGLCQACGTRLIHISTDCVFSGNCGMYTELDPPDAEDLYGRSKYLGEVGDHNCLTLRTSMIGRELGGTRGLVEWFLSNRGRTIAGYRHAVFSGFTTLTLSRIIGDIIESHPTLWGVYHLSAEPIDKYHLLKKLQGAFGIDIEIEPDSKIRIDRSLDQSRFRHATGIASVDWDEMIRELGQDPTPYDEWRAAV